MLRKLFAAIVIVVVMSIAAPASQAAMILFDHSLSSGAKQYCGLLPFGYLAWRVPTPFNLSLTNGELTSDMTQNSVLVSRYVDVWSGVNIDLSRWFNFFSARLPEEWNAVSVERRVAAGETTLAELKGNMEFYYYEQPVSQPLPGSQLTLVVADFLLPEVENVKSQSLITQTALFTNMHIVSGDFSATPGKIAGSDAMAMTRFRMDMDAGESITNISLTHAPEPCTLALLAVGAGVLILRRRRRALA